MKLGYLLIPPPLRPCLCVFPSRSGRVGKASDSTDVTWTTNLGSSREKSKERKKKKNSGGSTQGTVPTKRDKDLNDT